MLSAHNRQKLHRLLHQILKKLYNFSPFPLFTIYLLNRHAAIFCLKLSQIFIETKNLLAGFEPGIYEWSSGRSVSERASNGGEQRCADDPQHCRQPVNRPATGVVRGPLAAAV